VTRPRRRSAFLLGAGVLAAVLVGGRWLALETAERAWASSIAGGAAYLMARDLARLVSGVFLLLAIAWGTGNLLFVYRAIGSVQLPRRLGDLEIVEAVPQRLLLAGTVASGLLYGFLLALGTGDWWMQAAIAARAPAFGVTDPVLHRDVGYYLAELPWLERIRGFALAATVSATLLVALLYLGIGSLRFRRWLPYASAHARAHLGVLLTALGLTLTWGAALDPAQTVAGLHGTLTRGALAVRVLAAPFLVVLGVAAALASLVWAARERAPLLAAGWGMLLGASFLAYVVLPGALGSAATRRARATPADAAFSADQRRLEGLAFGAESLEERAPPGFASAGAALAALPLWDDLRVLAAAAARRDLLGPRAAPAAAALSLRLAGRATWVVAATPVRDSVARSQPALEWTALHRGAWARAGRPFAATESDTGLEFAPLETRDSATWFGLGFHDFAVAAPDSWPRLRAAGLPLVGGWRRTALAWSLQSPELARTATDGLLLLWHRDVGERLERLAAGASFDDPTPVIAEGTLWWVAYGYFEAEAFPLARPVQWGGRDVHYLRAGLVGVVDAASGDTRLFLAPGADPLAAAWARLLGPLVRPSDSLPAALRAQLPYPRRTFRIGATLAARWRGDSLPWSPRPREPFELAAPALSLPEGAGKADPARLGIWTAQGFEAGDPAEVIALLAGAVSPAGPRLLVWRPGRGIRLAPVLGSPTETAPGVLRLWNAAGALLSAQALFAQPATGGPPSRIDTLFVTWDERRGQGPTAAAALRDMLATSAGGPAGPGGPGGLGGLGGLGGPGEAMRGLADTSLASRWEAARRLAARADAALAAGDLEAFGRYYAELQQLLGVGRRKLAPTHAPR